MTLLMTAAAVQAAADPVGRAGNGASRDGAGPRNPTGGRDSEVLPSTITLRERINEEYAGVSNPPHCLDQVVKVGEKLEYAVKWKALPAGRLILRTKRRVMVRGRYALAFEMHAESNDVLDLIYEVNTRITSIADSQTGMSYLFKRKLREGRRRVDDRLEFDYDHAGADGMAQAVAKYSKIKGGATRNSEPRPIPGPVQDCLSAIYYLRQCKLEFPGDQCTFLIGGRKDVDTVTVTVKRRQRLRLRNLGVFDCLVVRPKGEKEESRTSLVAARGSADIWLERNTRIPLLVVVKVPIGNVKAVLINAQGCDLSKYRLDAGKQGEKPTSKDPVGIVGHPVPGMPASPGIAPPTPAEF